MKKAPLAALWSPTVACALLLLGGCAASIPAPQPCGSAAGLAPCPPAGAITDPTISQLHDDRRYISVSEIDADPVRIGVEADIPVVDAFGRIYGPTNEAARDSLAAKIWLIENAQHTLDLTYYIFQLDLAGYAVIGALCDAVKRGVDVRLMVDSLGSFSTSKTALKALELCEEEAGFMRNSAGATTDRRARVQVVIFNAVSNLRGNPNRRSHDKLLVADGAFPDKAYMMTGGRNISMNYYGITEDGNIEPHTYRDSEILLHSVADQDEPTIGEISTVFYTLLFLYQGNSLLRPVNSDQARRLYFSELAKADAALGKLKSMPLMSKNFDGIAEQLANTLQPTQALLAHNLANLDSKRAVSEAVSNLESNPNSILYVMQTIQDNTDDVELTRLVSPYLFLAHYTDQDGKTLLDEAQSIRAWLDENPQATIEIIINSALTSDNFSTQSVIDMDTVPRLLLDPELREAWLDMSFEDELGGEITRSAAWMEQINHPRLRVYQTGKLDSDQFGPDGIAYGKLHAKFWLEEDIGFVGTDNFDYRSRLFNSEMGYFFRSEALAEQLDEAVEQLKSISYRWGSPEWLEMRRKLVDKGGMAGSTTRQQRTVYKTLKATGLIWLF